MVLTAQELYAIEMMAVKKIATTLGREAVDDEAVAARTRTTLSIVPLEDTAQKTSLTRI